MVYGTHDGMVIAHGGSHMIGTDAVLKVPAERGCRSAAPGAEGFDALRAS